MISVDLRTVGRECKRFRRSLGKTQNEVALEIGYALNTISQFECGGNNNLYIFLWYIKNGIDIQHLKEVL